MKKMACSVVIPTRDCRPFLGRALQSVRAQRVENIEILAIDDGSTDGTDVLLSQEASKDPRLKVIEADGVGPSAARNIAIARAEADWIAFLDADDAWRPGKLSTQLALHDRRPDIGFSFTDYLHVDVEGGSHGTCFDYWKPSYVPLEHTAYAVIPDAEFGILGCNVVGTSTVVASRNALQKANGFPTHLGSAEDWLLWLTLARSSDVAASRAVTLDYLIRPNSVSRNSALRIAAMQKIISSYSDSEGRAARRAYRQALARISLAQAEDLRQSRRYIAAAWRHIEACLRWPENRVARAALRDLVSAIGEKRGEERAAAS